MANMLAYCSLKVCHCNTGRYNYVVPKSIPMAPSYSADIFDRRRKKEGSMMFQAQKSLYRRYYP